MHALIIKATCTHSYVMNFEHQVILRCVQASSLVIYMHYLPAYFSKSFHHEIISLHEDLTHKQILEVNT